jgi:hypothetical protein
VKRLIAFLQAWGAQTFIAGDQLVNAAFGPIFSWTIGYADETLSARAWRCRAKPWGRVFLPLIDLLFFWQATDPELLDAAGQPIRSHCHRAYLKEQERRNLPPEYRAGAGERQRSPGP